MLRFQFYLLSSLLQTVPWIADRHYRSRQQHHRYALKSVLYARGLQYESKRNNMLNPSLPLKMLLSKPVNKFRHREFKRIFLCLLSLPVYQRQNGFTVAYFKMSFSKSCWLQHFTAPLNQLLQNFLKTCLVFSVRFSHIFPIPSFLSPSLSSEKLFFVPLPIILK